MSRFVRIRRSTALVGAAVLCVGIAVPAAIAASGKSKKAAIYLVGGGVRSINPTEAMLADNDFYLGGYGFASGHVGNVTAIPPVTDPRFATGILGDQSFNRFASPDDATYESDGSHSRAFAVSDGKATTVLAQIETQGYFDAYKQGPFGLNEIRKDAAAQIADLVAHRTASKKGKPQLLAPAPTASQIVVDSDHSHGGPDTAGVWGGVPTSYLKLVHDRTVAAIVDAFQAIEPATLTHGIAHAGVAGNFGEYPPQECIDAGKTDCIGVSNADWLLHNQFSEDPNNKTMDDEVRVFQARSADDDTVLATYVNYASHPTVLGGDNTKVTGDYVGRLNVAIEKEFGGFGMDQVGTLGREQPERTDCPGVDGGDSNPVAALCKLDNYASRVLVKIKDAVKNGTTLSGAPVVGMNSYFLTDTTTNPVLAAGEFGGQAIGAPFGRAATPPWYDGTQLGTSYYVGRIGPTLITGGPGEMYAQIWQKVVDTVACTPKLCADTAKDSGITSVMNLGTAGDFLGYIIAPLESYPEPMRASLFDGKAPPTGSKGCEVPDPRHPNDDPPLTTYDSPVGCPSPIDNDNYFFNVSHTFGERLTCDFLRGAGDIVANDATKYWLSYDRCAAFVNDFAAPAGVDMQFPNQPDLSDALTHM